MTGPFAEAFAGEGGRAPYLRLLNLREGSAEPLPKLRETALMHPRAALALLEGANWRPHVIASVACYLGDVPGAVDALWSRIAKGSWAGPQIAAALSLVDEHFVSSALSMLQKPGLGMSPLLALLQEDLGDDDSRVAGVTFFAELGRKTEVDSYMKGRIALSYRAGLSALAAEVFPDVERFAQDAARTSRAARLDFGVQSEDVTGGKRCRFFDGDEPIVMGRALELMRTNAHFRRRLSDNVYFATRRTAGRWELPPISEATQEDPFEFVVVREPSLSRRPDFTAFAEHFVSSERVVAFDNLGRNAKLVVPCPSGERDYSHLGTFLHEAPWSDVHALWKRVGLEVQLALAAKPLWLSTAGMGVPWLHVRIDQRPKYYKHTPYRDPAYRAEQR